MDWLPLASAALGGLIGSGSTLMADRVRWRREVTERTAERQRAEQTQQRATRHGVYVEYLTALSRIRNGLREMAHDDVASPDERLVRLQQVFLDSGAYELRSQIQLVAPELVAEQAEAAYKSLRRLRMAIEDGASFQDIVYLERRDHYHGELATLKQALRRDLGIDAL
ncbi:hypothetical protein ACF1BP_18480 [Streptomyces sp. NPDC014735]|uniref:hypothetical protein n=1 Tax=unclassified Streptomyces TaxID=2593676 RepID=UPI0036F7E6CF